VLKEPFGFVATVLPKFVTLVLFVSEKATVPLVGQVPLTVIAPLPLAWVGVPVTVKLPITAACEAGAIKMAIATARTPARALDLIIFVIPMIPFN